MKNIRYERFLWHNFAGRYLRATRRYILAKKFQNRIGHSEGMEEINIGSMLMQIFDRVFENTANDGWSMKLARLIVALRRLSLWFHAESKRQMIYPSRLLRAYRSRSRVSSFVSSVSELYQTINYRCTWSLDQTNKKRISLGDFWSVDLRESLGRLVVFTWNRSILIVTRISFAYCYFVVINDNFE